MEGMRNHPAKSMPAGSGRWLLICAAIFAAALAPRLYLALNRYHALVGDEISYANCAANIAAGRGFVFTPSSGPLHVFLPPGYPAFLAPFLALTPPALPISHFALAAQALAGAAAACLAAAVARRYGGHFAGAVTGFLVAVHPYLMFNASRVLTEALAVPLFALFLYLFIKDDAGRLRITAAGAVMALLTLTRPAFLYVGMFTWLLLLIPRGAEPWRPRVLRTALAFAAFAAILAPWTIRNYVIAGRFIPVAEGTGTALYQKNRLLEEGAPSLWDLAETAGFQRYLATVGPDPVARELAFQDYARARGRELIARHKGAYLKACGERLLHTFALAPTLAEWDASHKTRVRFIPAITAYSILLYGAALAGFLWMPGRMPRPTFLVAVIVITGIHTLTIALLRYRASTDVILAVAAGIGAAALWSRLRRRQPQGGR